MAIIRHEINILNHNFLISSPAFANEIAYLDTTLFSGTVTYYFEVVAKVNGACNVTLRRSGTTTDDAAIPLTNTPQFDLFRVAFTPPSGGTAYTVGTPNTATLNMLAARIIVIQDTGNDGALLNSSSQFEIGAYETAKTNLTISPLTNPKYWLYDSRNWDGQLTFSAEVVWVRSSTMDSTTILLEEDDGSFKGWVTNVAIENNSSPIAVVRTRVDFFPKHGRNYRITSKSSSTMSHYDIYCAKIIVTQLGPTQLDIFYVDGHTAITDFGNDWTDDALAFDNATGSLAYSEIGEPADYSNSLLGQGTTALLTGLTINEVSGRVLASASAGGEVRSRFYQDDTTGIQLHTTEISSTTSGNWSNFSIFTPSGTWSWGLLSTGISVRSFNFNGGPTGRFNKAEVWVTSFLAQGITSFEEHYLLINSAQSSAGLKSFTTLFDTGNEWSGVNNTYITSEDGSATTSATELVFNPSGSQTNITYGIVSGINQKRGEVIRSFTGGLATSLSGHDTGFAQIYLCNLSGGATIIGAEVSLAFASAVAPITGFTSFDFVSGNFISGTGFWSSFNITGTGITTLATIYQFYFDSGVNLASGTSGYLRMFKSLPTGISSRFILTKPNNANSTYRPQFFWTQTNNIWTQNANSYLDFRPIVSFNPFASGLVGSNVISS